MNVVAGDVGAHDVEALRPFVAGSDEGSQKPRQISPRSYGLTRNASGRTPAVPENSLSTSPLAGRAAATYSSAQGLAPARNGVATNTSAAR